MNSNQHRIGVFSGFLIFCAGASRELLKNVPVLKLPNMFVLDLLFFFTAILATISSFFAFSLIFDEILLVVIFSVFWGAIIFNLDRYIVSSMRHSEKKWQEVVKVIPRLLIAVLIAVIVSKPLEIQIFKSEIQSYLLLQNAKKSPTWLKYTSDFLN